jgi:hypothetical protein
MEYLYRIKDVLYAPPLDEWDNPIGNSQLEVVLTRYEIIKKTNCGYWINDGLEKRFVLMRWANGNPVRKIFACESIKEAKESFIIRKQRQIGLYHSKIERAKLALEILKRKTKW